MLIFRQVALSSICRKTPNRSACPRCQRVDGKGFVMLTRLRLLKAAAALLYVGPLFAGISGLGWGMVAPFVAIFVVWLMVLRPEQWPATPQEWLMPPAWGAAFAQVLSQILLVTVLLAVGRGIGALAGFVPIVNPILPLALSFLAIPLCRMLWDAREAANQGVFLDEEAEIAQAPRAAAEAAAAIVPLLNLPESASDSEVMSKTANALSGLAADLRLDALTAALSRPNRSHAALRRALVLWCSEPEVVAPARVRNAMVRGFVFADRDPDLLRLYVPRAIALTAAFPDRAAEFPDPKDLRAAAENGLSGNSASDLPEHLRADLCDGLLALARSLDRALGAATKPLGEKREAVAKPSARVA